MIRFRNMLFFIAGLDVYAYFSFFQWIWLDFSWDLILFFNPLKRLVIFFATPWIIFCIGIYFTATITSIKKLCLHRLFGNMLLKACLATPFARLAGSYLQRCGWDEEMGYYTGIGGVSGIVGIWQCYELWEFFRSIDTKPESKTS